MRRVHEREAGASLVHLPPLHSGQVPRLQADHVDDARAVGARLRDARTRAGLTQRQLSFPGCTPAYISRIEAGARVPSLQLLRKLGDRLGVSADYLAIGKESVPAETDFVGDALLALRLGDEDRAIEVLTEAVGRTGTRDELRAHAGFGQIAFKRGDHAAAIDHFEQALARPGLDGAERAAAVEALGRAYALSGEAESAISLFEQALASAEQREDLIERLRFGVLLANALIDSGSLGRAEELLGGALAASANDADPLTHVRLWWAQSRLHSFKGESELAARYARLALDVLEQTEHVTYAARAHQLLAHIEIDRGRAEQALDLLESGYPLIVASGNKFEKAIFELERARALARLGRQEEAAAAAMQTTSTLAEASPVDAGRAYALVAEVYEELGDAARARELYELAAEILSATDRYRVHVLSRLAALLEAQGRTEAALALLKQALETKMQLAPRPVP